ncbi:CbiQ family ECF transporter T component [Corynebacterium rouxii]|uniref:CbiQ family ECF transporter T component n=1 Tax=Corynebacterium rouxii TaxID=2719119 RepID=UPI0012DC2DFC|nr:CbiQ family ECF transporter T component [Corynebacterium rouxii]
MLWSGAAAKSPWAQVNVGEKLLLLLDLIFEVLTLPPQWGTPVVVAVIVILVIAARILLHLYFACVSAPAAFITLGVIPLMFTVGAHGTRFIAKVQPQQLW